MFFRNHQSKALLNPSAPYLMDLFSLDLNTQYIKDLSDDLRDWMCIRAEW